MKRATHKENKAASGTQRIKVAVVQAASVVFNRKRTLEKVHVLAREAARQGAQLVLFPEAFISAYPRGLDFGAVVGSRSEKGREDFRRYWESSVDVPGPAVEELGRSARSNSIYLVIGVSNGTAALFTAPCCSSLRTAAFWGSTGRSCQLDRSVWYGVSATDPRFRCSTLPWGR